MCKVGRLGELRKIVDCQTSQLVDKPEEQSSHCEIRQSSLGGQENQLTCDDWAISSNSDQANYLHSVNQVIQSNNDNEVSQVTRSSEDVSALMLGDYQLSDSFALNINQNFEGVIFENEFQGIFI